jgi:endonuclease/exonuclease/phosphatase family metal-dependent hydrolase
MAAIGRRLCDLDVDVAAFQEVWTRGSRRALRAACAPAGLEHVWTHHTAFGGSGLLVLSRLPIAAAHFEPFSVRGHPERVDHGDYYGGKGFLRISLEHPEGALSFVTTHLHARYAADVEHAYVPQRIAQIVQLASAIWSSEEPTLAVGDFNFTESDVEHRVLCGLAALRDVAAELDARQATALRGNPFRGVRKPDRRIDYVFARDGVHARVAPLRIERVFDEVFTLEGRDASVSDHAGLLAELEILPGGTGYLAPRSPSAIQEARVWLARGRADAVARREGARTYAGLGLACAGTVALGRRRLTPISRRRVLRGGLGALALLALPPSVGLSLVSEVVAPEEMRAFDALSARLDGAGPPDASRRA